MQTLEATEAEKREQESIANAQEEGKILSFRRGASRFYVGLQVRLNGGAFAVRSIGRDGLVLRPLPGTKLLVREMTAAEHCLPALQQIADTLQDLPVATAAKLAAGDATIEGMAERAIRFYAAAMAAQTDGHAEGQTIVTDQA